MRAITIRQDSRENMALASIVISMILCMSSLFDVVHDQVDWTVHKMCLAIVLAVVSFWLTMNTWGKRN
jgi:hypothetical protein